MEGKLDALVDSQRHTKAAMAALDDRTTKLERWQSRLIGGAAAVGFLFAVVLKLVG